MAQSWDEKNTRGASGPKGEAPKERAAQQPASSLSDIPLGFGLGKYRILERLRTSHNGVLYKARDAMLDRLVTIKQMTPELVDDPIACGEFKREAQLLARIPKEARGLVHIHELIEAERGLFIVQEHVNGDWLEILVSKRRADATDAVRLLLSACRGLEVLHSRRIVHRDICPTNLIVTSKGWVRISNLACAVHEGDNTLPPVVRAKYAAPELQACREHDARVDIYSLGFLIYELSVGRPLFTSHFAEVTDDERWRQWHLDRQLSLPDATSLNSTVPASLAAILRRMTAKDLDHRLSSIQEVIEILTREFSIAKPNARPALSAQQAQTRILEIRTPLRHALSGRPSSANQETSLQQGGGLDWLFKHDQSTSRHVVQPLGLDNDAATSRKARPHPAALPLGLPAPSNARHHRSSRRTLPPAPPRAVIPRNVPPPEHIVEPRRRRRRGLALPLTVAAILIVAAAIGVPRAWTRISDNPEKRTIQSIIDNGMAAYTSDDYQAAFDHFQEAADLSAGKPGLAAEGSEAENMLLIVDAQLALAKDDFDRVIAIIQRAEIRGVNPSILSGLRTKYWNKKDAYRLAADVRSDMEQDLFSSAALKLGDYEEKARAAGLDPSAARDRLELARTEKRYQEALQSARDELARKHFQTAELECNKAQSIKETSATRRLHQQIVDARRRDDFMVVGERALQDGDPGAAERAFTSANEIEPSAETEQRIRTARAARLIQDAREAIGQGDLLGAERSLRRSRWELEGSAWGLPNPEAKRMLENMKPAFEAARLARNGDRAMARGDYLEAVRLYELALPALPSPASDIVQTKLVKARKATTQPKE
jgi:serine/threonine protein kinase/tetratricopeptide (TPR) repeat protein